MLWDPPEKEDSVYIVQIACSVFCEEKETLNGVLYFIKRRKGFHHPVSVWLLCTLYILRTCSLYIQNCQRASTQITARGHPHTSLHSPARGHIWRRLHRLPYMSHLIPPLTSDYTVHWALIVYSIFNLVKFTSNPYQGKWTQSRGVYSGIDSIASSEH